MSQKKIILASGSKIRAKLLEKCGIRFIQIPLNCDEDSIQTTNPKSFAYEACKLKYQNAIKLTKDSKSVFSHTPFLVADSVVSIQDQLQRKPKTKEEALKMLESQSGSEIKIITALILKSRKLELIDISQTIFQLAKFDPQDLQSYLHSDLWKDKAGAVMIEGFHHPYIKKQKGLLSCALGLSLEKFLPFFGII